jgi:hypothetical protein
MGGSRYFTQVLSVNSGDPGGNTFLTHLCGGMALRSTPEGWSVRGGADPDAPAGVLRVRVMGPRIAQITPFPADFEDGKASGQDLPGGDDKAAPPPVKLGYRRLGDVADR